MKARNLFVKVLSFALVAAMLLGMLPIFASAEETEVEPLVENDGLYTSKTVTVEENGTYTITLEAYATGSVTTTSTTLPCDIVLVLDMSSSMTEGFGGTTRLAALKTAVQNFANSVFDKAKGADGTLGTEDDVNHRVSIITFATNDSIKCGLKDVSKSANQTSINSIISALSTSQGTVPGEGLDAAATVFGNYSGNDSVGTETRQRVVVLFTDGYPSTTGSSNFTPSYANTAIAEAAVLKGADYNALVYSVAVLDGADPTADFTGLSNNTKKVNCFLHAVSSNYPNATATAGSSTFNPTMGTRAEGNYYLSASSPNELNNIFTTISNSVGSSSIELGEEAVMRDIISPSFALPENFGSNDAANVTVYTADYRGNNAFDTRVQQSATVKVDGTTKAPGTSGISVTVDTANKNVDITGFDYAANYCVDASGTVLTSGKKIIVVITGIEVDENNFVSGEVLTNDEDAGIYENGDMVEVIENFNECKVTLAAASYVLDYAKPFTMALSDWGLTSVNHLALNTRAITDFNTAGLDLTNGVVALSDEGYTYTPQTMSWDGYDRFYAFGVNAAARNIVTTPLWSQINVIPANNVYYEDSFVTNKNTGTVGIAYSEGWKVEGTESANTESANTDVQGGWQNGDLADDTAFTDGSAHMAEAGATVTFTFTGTGVDIYSYTDIASGAVRAILRKVNEDNTTELTKYLIVDNLAESGKYYQIPTLTFNGLDYGTYSVELKVNSVEHLVEGERKTYYLDGIRIYNPLGNNITDETVKDAYEDELNAVFTEVRDILIDANTFSADANVTGAVFIDDPDAVKDDGTTEATVGIFEDYGPKNEVYLASGQAIVFKVDTTSGNNYYVGLKAMEGVAVTAVVTNGTGTATHTISHTSDLYYEITPSANGYIMIQNTGSALLSITKLRTTNDTAPASGIVEASAQELVMYASSFTLLSNVETDETPVEPETDVTEPSEPVVPEVDVEIENPAEPEEPSEDEAAKEEAAREIKRLVKKIFDAFRGWLGR